MKVRICNFCTKIFGHVPIKIRGTLPKDTHTGTFIVYLGVIEFVFSVRYELRPAFEIATPIIRRMSFNNLPSTLNVLVMSHHSTGRYITDVIEKCLQTNNETGWVKCALLFSTLSQSLAIFGFHLICLYL